MIFFHFITYKEWKTEWVVLSPCPRHLTQWCWLLAWCPKLAWPKSSPNMHASSATSRRRRELAKWCWRENLWQAIKCFTACHPFGLLHQSSDVPIYQTLSFMAITIQLCFHNWVEQLLDILSIVLSESCQLLSYLFPSGFLREHRFLKALLTEMSKLNQLLLLKLGLPLNLIRLMLGPRCAKNNQKLSSHCVPNFFFHKCGNVTSSADSLQVDSINRSKSIWCSNYHSNIDLSWKAWKISAVRLQPNVAATEMDSMCVCVWGVFFCYLLN